MGSEAAGHLPCNYPLAPPTMALWSSSHQKANVFQLQIHHERSGYQRGLTSSLRRVPKKVQSTPGLLAPADIYMKNGSVLPGHTVGK